MNRDVQHRLVAAVLAVRDDEDDYEFAGDTLAAYVDATIRGDRDPEQDARIGAHLLQSPETADVLDTLLELAAMEQAGRLPGVEDLWREVRRYARPGIQVGAGRSLEAPWWRSLFAGLSGLRITAFRPALAAAPMAAAIALALTSAGWWRAETRARRADAEMRGLQTALSRIDATTVGVAQRYPYGAPSMDAASVEAAYRALVDTVGTAREERFSRGQADAWMRVVFAPGHRRALVWAGDLPASVRDDAYDCFLMDRDGAKHRLRMLEHLDGETEWWHVESDRPIDEYVAMAMTAGEQGDPVVQVALQEP